MVASLPVLALLLAASRPPPLQERVEPLSISFAAPPARGENPFHAGHRAPLRPEPLIKLPVGAVRARGWLKAQLESMAEGMFGRLPELSHWCRPERSAWRSRDGSGENGWEELPYWLKGFTSLAFLLDESGGAAGAARGGGDARVALATEWLEAILASQREDGWFGPEANRAQPDLWPNMPALWALRTWHEATGDPRILEFICRYFRWQLALPRERLLPDSWQKVRGGDNLDVVYWLHDRTGEPWLLELAQRLHERTVDWTAGVANWHGVNFCQGFREPLQFFVQSGEERHRAATYRNYAVMMEKFGQVPGGMFGADENCREGHADPRQAAEACSMVEFMRSFEMIGAQTGDVAWFDRCEEVAFNSLPAAMDAELRSLHYLTAPNLAVCDEADHSPGIQNGGCMLAFSPDERYRCCQHNVVQGWPYFTEHLWFATRDRGLAACLFAPCRVRARAGDGADVEIDVATRYPFEPGLELRVRSSRPARFPVYLRVPGWCSAPRLALDGRDVALPDGGGPFVRIERVWSGESALSLTLPAKLRVRRFPAQGDCAAVDLGPITFSLDIAEEWRQTAPGARWPTREVHPATPWNFGLVLGEEEPAATLERIGTDGHDACTFCGSTLDGGTHFEPFSEHVPLRVRARARRIPAWRLDHTGLVAPLQRSPVRSEEPVEEVLLIPMGCARLRITAFPVIGAGDGAHEWTAPRAPPRSSHAHDDPFALTDGILPASSIDHGVPRFTFWDRLGTVEWVQLDFESPRRIARCAVYWFDDTGIGRCRVPKSWRLLRPDGEEWREVEGASGYGVAPDRLNEVIFAPVTTSALRLEVTLQPGVSAGLFEWTVGE